MVPTQSLKYALVLFYCTFVLNFLAIPLYALNIGAETTGVAVSVSKECSRQCESSFCAVPPLLRYGKYCGLLYSGCPGERPCDGLDACCMKHDKCVGDKNNDYLSQECSQTLINCMNEFKNTRGPTFKGNMCQVDDVIEVINVVMEAALLAGRVLHKP
ncbi:phospholipase A2-alpha-like [Gastrolobium bilobum]|uniref:phospholipase A2-alpha-like n=1 Tax=Gastrolobium bilobum TaxID=150636 RepID=UPI002AB0BEF9|nr:phospholipase A2-alpha-like [Gastrolobium bilobum]